MVNSRFLLAASAAFCLGLLVGCAGVWGESAVRPAILRLQAPEGSCANPSLILEGTEIESLAAFECLASQIGDVWEQVEGDRIYFFSDPEIASLVRAGVVNLYEFGYRRCHSKLRDQKMILRR